MSGDTPRTRAVLALLLLTSFTLLSVDIRGGQESPLQPLRTMAGAAFGPVLEAADAAVRPVGTLVEDVASSRGDRDRIAELERERDALRLQLRSSGLARSRAGELDKLLRISSVGQYPLVPAQVIAIGRTQSFSWTVAIDAGSKDGIRRDMTVLNGDGLVGRVRTVSPTTSTVVLAADPATRVGVRLERSLHVGLATGAGPGRLEVEMLQPQSTLKVGDRMVTYGSAGGMPYVAGVPVGEVVRVSGWAAGLTKRVTVRPYVDFSALDLVGVVVAPPRTDPRDTVLPPKPGARR